jgi:hypothetical protein
MESDNELNGKEKEVGETGAIYFAITCIIAIV